MDPLVAVGGMLLVLALAYAVGSPFLARPPAPTPATGARRERLLGCKENLYASLKDLELDRDLGRMSPADYGRLRQPLEEEALRVLQEIDELDEWLHPASLRQRVEAEVRARRQAAPSGPTWRCPVCQAPHRQEDHFCAQCGAPLESSEEQG